MQLDHSEGKWITPKQNSYHPFLFESRGRKPLTIHCYRDDLNSNPSFDQSLGGIDRILEQRRKCSCPDLRSTLRGPPFRKED